MSASMSAIRLLTRRCDCMKHVVLNHLQVVVHDTVDRLSRTNSEPKTFRHYSIRDMIILIIPSVMVRIGENMSQSSEHVQTIVAFILNFRNMPVPFEFVVNDDTEKNQEFFLHEPLLLLWPLD